MILCQDQYPDRLEFINPGTILLGKEQMLRGGISKPRNKLILNMLNYIGVGERAGSGVPDIYKIWAKENYEEPTVDEVSGRENTIHTIVTLPLITKNQDFLPKSPEKSPKNFEIEERKKAVIALISSDNS